MRKEKNKTEAFIIKPWSHNQRDVWIGKEGPLQSWVECQNVLCLLDSYAPFWHTEVSHGVLQLQRRWQEIQWPFEGGRSRSIVYPCRWSWTVTACLDGQQHWIKKNWDNSKMSMFSQNSRKNGWNNQDIHSPKILSKPPTFPLCCTGKRWELLHLVGQVRKWPL